ncbi:hypothetical protein D187_010012 [Cystobacter fuscus DSM 2262]|uniref:Uncharacterized protein n=1 Tax=Cystobacter fuscus (strain ATCC 25194 / DSM 2262 / NBRC 100088 / M29) TaxID=1242864 RepID=S9QZP7_CYSF2|nr:hypothetical protein D187_010012 [Cystobacter fuscus DSM 2262]
MYGRQAVPMEGKTRPWRQYDQIRIFGQTVTKTLHLVRQEGPSPPTPRVDGAHSPWMEISQPR